MIFDTHAHYDDRAFDEDREELILSLKDKGIGAVCNVSSSMESLESCRALSDRYDFFYHSVGVHPDDIGELTEDDLSVLEEAASHEKVVAIGETGLDYYWDKAERQLQKEWFARQIALAGRLGLPLIVHSRQAQEDTLDVMRAEKADGVGGVMHCFSYDRAAAKTVLDMGFFIGIGGVLTFKNAPELKEVAKLAPIESIVLETDCPYLAPVPFRGKRNDSSHLRYVVETLAQMKGITPQEVEDITWENARRLYRLV